MQDEIAKPQARSLKEILEEAKELGIESVEVAGVRYYIAAQLHAAAAAPQQGLVPEMKPEEIMKPLSQLDEYSEEEITYWATPYFDEIQARKEELKKRKEEDDAVRKSA